MVRYTIEQRVKVIQAYYENGRSNQSAYRALRDFFGQFNCPNVRTIGKIVHKFEQTGSVGDVETPVHARTARTAENIAAVRDSVAEEQSISTRHRAQRLHLSRSSLMNIMHKDLHLQIIPRTMTSIKLGTHNGPFHCDEILALAMLRKLPEYESAELVRSRDPHLLSTCDVVFDVGGEFDPARHRYDHHQPSFNMTIQDFHPSLKPAVKLSSAGLIYAHFGKRVIASIINEPSLESDIINTLFTRLYADFVAEVDAIDNGIAIASVPLNYTINTDLSSRVGLYNPAWNVPNEDENECFMRAFKMVDEDFVQCVKSLAASWYPARDVVKEAITTRFGVHPSGCIMRIDGPGCPWKAHFYDLEKILIPGVAEVSTQDSEGGDFRKRPVFVITERKAPNGKEYNVQTIACRPDQPFTQRTSLAAAWAGKRGEELSKLVGIDGAVFVHVNRFIGVHKTFEGALHMAVKSLEEAGYL